MSLSLTPVLATLVSEEARALASMSGDPGTRARYARLAAEAARGEVSQESAGSLGALLELGLSTGRIRAIHGPQGEQAASRLFSRTPQGRALREQTDALNTALTALDGQPLGALRVAARWPGDYTLTLQAGPARLALTFGVAGASVRSVEVGGAP